MTTKALFRGAESIEIELSAIENGFPPSLSTRDRNPATCLPDLAIFRGRQPDFYHFLSEVPNGENGGIRKIGAGVSGIDVSCNVGPKVESIQCEL